MATINPRRIVGLCVLVALLSGTACTERRIVDGTGSQPVSGTAYPASAGGGQVAVDPPQDIQAVTIRIADGRFDADVYDAQARPARLAVLADGGTYNLAIEGLLSAQPLEPNGTTMIGANLATPGRYTMRLSGASSATATLNVRAAGDR